MDVYIEGYEGMGCVSATSLSLYTLIGIKQTHTPTTPLSPPLLLFLSSFSALKTKK